MSQVQFLIDESLPLSLVAGLRRREPTIEVRRVGQDQMPAFATPDAAVLLFCEQNERLFVSLDTVELVMELAEDFDLTISDEDAQGIRTVEEAIRYISKRLGDDWVPDERE